MSVSGVRKQFKRYLDAAMDLTQELYIPIHCATGLPKILLKAAEIFPFLSDLLGHESIETTRIYLRRTSTEQARNFQSGRKLVGGKDVSWDNEKSRRSRRRNLSCI